MRVLRLLCGLVVAGLWALGCAKAPGPAPLPLSEAQTLQVWQRFSETFLSEDFRPRPFLADGSLIFTRAMETDRVKWSLWGNPAGKSALAIGPSRLDLRATVGTLLLLAREDDGLVAFVPGQETAFAGPAPRDGLASLGLPLPFDLGGLGVVLQGSLAGLVPAKYESLEPHPQGVAVVFAPGSAVASAVIGLDGRPLELMGPEVAKNVLPWKAAFVEWGEPKFPQALGPLPLPKRITLTLPKGDGQMVARLRVSDMELRPVPWPENSLDLTLPPDTPVRPFPRPQPRTGDLGAGP